MRRTEPTEDGAAACSRRAPVALRRPARANTSPAIALMPDHPGMARALQLAGGGGVGMAMGGAGRAVLRQVAVGVMAGNGIAAPAADDARFVGALLVHGMRPAQRGIHAEPRRREGTRRRLPAIGAGRGLAAEGHRAPRLEGAVPAAFRSEEHTSELQS